MNVLSTLGYKKEIKKQIKKSNNGPKEVFKKHKSKKSIVGARHKVTIMLIVNPKRIS